MRTTDQQRGCPVSVSLGSRQSPKRIDAAKARKEVGWPLGDERKAETRRKPVCAERQSPVTGRLLLAPLAADWNMSASSTGGSTTKGRT